MTLQEALALAQPADERARAAAGRHWDSVAKPLGSLGLLERAVIDIAGMTGTSDVRLGRRAVIAMCADNGVVAQGVTQTGQEVTAIVTENMGRGDSSVCNMGKIAGAEVFPVDIGVARPVEGGRIIQRNVRRGTRDMTEGPAMTHREAVRAIETGIELVGALKAEGYGVFVTGEMGIGNTTTSSAIISVLLGVPSAEVTGRGAGLSGEGLARKVAAIEKAVAVNRPEPSDGLDVLAKVGGLDIAGLAGVFIGGAVHHVPVLIDGIISAAAALAAASICPACRDYMLATHVSKEPAGMLVLEALGKRPFIMAEMCLGEGTGAVAALPMIDMALAVYHNMSTFEDIKIEAYTPQE